MPGHHKLFKILPRYLIYVSDLLVNRDEMTSIVMLLDEAGLCWTQSRPYARVMNWHSIPCFLLVGWWDVGSALRVQIALKSLVGYNSKWDRLHTVSYPFSGDFKLEQMAEFLYFWVYHRWLRLIRLDWDSWNAGQMSSLHSPIAGTTC